ncbi:MAG: hypothetical protein ABJA16_02795, partial [Nakamurella sp.]
MTGGPTDHDSADDAGRPSARYRGVPTPTAHRHPFLNYSWHIVVAVFSVFVLAVTGVYWNIVRLGDQGLTNGSVDIGLGDGSSLI